MKNILFFLFIILIIFSLRSNKIYKEFFCNNDIYDIANTINYNNLYKKYIDLYFSDIIYKNQSNIYSSPNNKIFVSIASYRDPQCSITLIDLIKKAEFPQNLIIVICQQNDIDDDECSSFFKDKNIKTIRYNAKDARGPCWARFLIQQEWNGEEYYLQIDSHTRFVDKWDTKCISNLKKAQEKQNTDLICLSNYVSTFNINTNEIEINPLRGPMYIEKFDEKDGFFRYNAKYINNLSEPQESKGWSGCFSFSNYKIILDAPYDPYTPFLFFGEEMDIFARLYTKGWLMFVPAEPICFTLFDRSYRKLYWYHPDFFETVLLSKLRLYLRFGVYKDVNSLPDEIKKDLDLEKFSLGNKKTFDDFIKYCLE